jgi:hypothetical protein
MREASAYYRFAAMTDRRFCPLEEIIELVCTEDLSRFQVDLWALLMVVLAKLSGGLDRAKTDKDLRKSVRTYERIIGDGGASHDECREAASSVLAQILLRDGRQLALHEIN